MTTSQLVWNPLFPASRAYRKTYQKILRSPRRFASQELLPWQPSMLQSAISIYLYGVAISFFMYVPLIQKHGLKIGKLDFLLQFVYAQILLVCLVHLWEKFSAVVVPCLKLPLLMARGWVPQCHLHRYSFIQRSFTCLSKISLHRQVILSLARYRHG